MLKELYQCKAMSLKLDWPLYAKLIVFEFRWKQLQVELARR